MLKETIIFSIEIIGIVSFGLFIEYLLTDKSLLGFIGNTIRLKDAKFKNNIKIYKEAFTKGNYNMFFKIYINSLYRWLLKPIGSCIICLTCEIGLLYYLFGDILNMYIKLMILFISLIYVLIKYIKTYII